MAQEPAPVPRAALAPDLSAAAVAEPPAPPAVAAPVRPRFLPRTFESLTHGPFRWYMAAMLAWNAAMNMQLIARGWLAYELTGSYAALGVMGLGSGIPMLTLSMWGGVLADRVPRKRVMQIGQCGSALMATSVAVLLFTGLLRFEHLLAAAVFQGIVMATVMPSRQAMMPEVVGMERLMNAVPLQSAGMNLMRLIAPGIGGFLIVAVGAEWVYAVMAALYLLSVLTLFKVRTQPVAERPDRGPGGRRGRMQATGAGDLIEGLRYIARDPVILALLAASFFTSLLAMPYMQMLPGYVADVFDADAFALGQLQMATAVGSLAGSLVLASVAFARRGLLLMLSAILLGGSLFAFSSTDSYWLAAGFMVVLGVASAGRQTLGNVLLQTYVDDTYRGRVMSIYMTQFSLMSFGTFFVGLLSEALGPQVALGALGLSLVAVAIVFLASVPRLRNLA